MPDTSQSQSPAHVTVPDMTTQPPRLIYLVNEDWYFISHRLPMARAARDQGFEIHVAARVNRHADAIRAEKFQLHPIDMNRGGINPFKFFRAVCAVRRLYHELQPDVVHHIGMQSAMIGSVASLGMNLPQVNSFFGLGSTFSAHTLKTRFARVILRAAFPLLLNRRTSLTLVVNPDLRDSLMSAGVMPERIAVIPGSGVDVDHFKPLPEPPQPVTIAYVGRMLEDKGVRPLIEAHRRLRESGDQIQLLLAGTPDPANPNSIPQSDLTAWAQWPGVHMLGHVTDVRTVWAKAHIAVLPSRSEGLPLSLQEAAACGRALIASDVPGCREVARAGHNALLVPPDNPDALAAAIRTLVDDSAKRRAYGAAGRKLIETEYSSERVQKEIVAIYRRLIKLPAGHG